MENETSTRAIPPPIPVLILITDLTTGGAQRALLRFLSNVSSDQYRFTVVTLLDGDGRFAEEIAALGIGVIDLNMNPKWRLDRLFALIQIIRQHRPLILHAWMIHANIIGRLIGRITGIPNVIISRRTDRLGSPLRVNVNRLLSGWSDRVIAVSDETRQIELVETGLPLDRVVTVPNGIEMGQFQEIDAAARQSIRDSLGIAKNEFLIGSVGRLVLAKGYPDLISAMKTVVATNPNVKLIIIGEGELRSQLEAQAAHLGLTEHISLPGRRSDIPQFMQALDLFVLSSHWEGMPNALLEAMAAGTPSIATSVSAAPEIIGEDEFGLLVPSEDPSKMAEAILLLRKDLQLRQALGEAGRKRIETNYTLEASVCRTLEVYAELLDEKDVKSV
ncbi:MAG: glycosyltransferase [Chloroflexota bacterium]